MAPKPSNSKSKAQSQSQSQSQPAVAALFPTRFVPVEQGARPGHVVRRDPEGSLVTKSGRAELNRAGTDVVLDLANIDFADTTKCGIYWGADTDAMEVAGRVVDPSVPGVTPIRYDTRRKTITLWLTEVFKKHPELKPTSKAWVSLTRESDQEHGDYFIIHLNLALPRITVSRDSQSKSTSSKSAKSKKASETPNTPPKEGIGA